MIYAIIAFWILAINVMTLRAFDTDKLAAIQKEWRIPEKTLLWMSFAGGSVGAKLGQRRFRHKTRKQPFASILDMICIAQIVLLCLGVWQREWVSRYLSVIEGGLQVAIGHDPDKRILPRRFGPGS